MQVEMRFVPRLILALGRSTFFGRGASRRVLLRILEALNVTAVQTTYRRIPFLFYLDNPTERKAMFERYDDNELDFILGHMRSENSVFVDIGANSGFYTNYILGSSAAGCCVLAIEPNAGMVKRIRDNVALLQSEHLIRKSIYIEQTAVSDCEGQSFLDVEKGLGSANIISAKTRGAIEVPTMLLLTILEKHNISKIDSMKIDIEGHEDKALMPFLLNANDKLLPKSIVIEHTSQHEWSVDLMKELEKRAYKLIKKLAAIVSCRVKFNQLNPCTSPIPVHVLARIST